MTIISCSDAIELMNQVKKLKSGGVMLLVPKKLNPKVRQDLNNMHKKYDSI